MGRSTCQSGHRWEEKYGDKSKRQAEKKNCQNPMKIGSESLGHVTSAPSIHFLASPRTGLQTLGDKGKPPRSAVANRSGGAPVGVSADRRDRGRPAHPSPRCPVSQPVREAPLSLRTPISDKAAAAVHIPMRILFSCGNIGRSNDRPRGLRERPLA